MATSVWFCVPLASLVLSYRLGLLQVPVASLDVALQGIGCVSTVGAMCVLFAK